MKLRYVAATAAYCAGIFWLSSRPDPVPTDYDFSGFDKLAHMALYGGLAALVSVGMRRSGNPVAPWLQVLVPIAFALFYGVTDEIHQTFIPQRNFDPLDLVANTAGAVLVQALLCRSWGISLRAAEPQPETAGPKPG